MSAAEIVDWINSIIWSKGLIYLCLGAGLFFSILTRFVQVRQMKEMARLLIKGTSSDQGISSFQALAVSLSGRVGVGNIAGVAAAIGFVDPVLFLDVVSCIFRSKHSICGINVRSNL